MFNGFFSSAHFHHIFGCSVIFFLLFFNNHCLPMVILNNSVSVFKWKQLSYWPWGALFTFLLNTVFIVHVMYMVSFHVQSAFDIFWWSIALNALLWLCFDELPKPYQHFHSIHTLQTSSDCLFTGITHSGHNSDNLLLMDFWNVIK